MKAMRTLFQTERAQKKSVESLERIRVSNGAISATSREAGCPAVLNEVPVQCVRVAAAANAGKGPRSAKRCEETTEIHINYLVMGEIGLGKSTFIQNLVSGFKVAQAGNPNVDQATTMDAFKADPQKLCTVLEPLELPEGNQTLHITIQDAPGWGSEVNMRGYLRTIINFLLERRAQDYDMIQSSNSSCKPSGGSSKPAHGSPCSVSSMGLKHSITACLYLLPPHRTKKVDLVMMAAVSQLVAVIPLISKADAMTDGELADYRQELLAMLSHPAKYVPEVSTAYLEVRGFAFEQRLLSSLGLQQPPFAVICSRHKEACGDEELLAFVGPFGQQQHVQPVRQYSWGAAYPWSRAHNSDLIPLKRLLLGDDLSGLHAMLEDSMKRHRFFCKEYCEFEFELQALMQDTCKFSKPLANDDYAKVRGSVAKAQAARQKLQKENQLLFEKLQQAEAECSKLKVKLNSEASKPMTSL